MKQAGATGVVSALHEVPENVVWSPDLIAERKLRIEAARLRWSVVESIPVPSTIKRGDRGRKRAIGVWKDSLANVGRAGVPVVCYNFMAVVDWTRTDPMLPMPHSGCALRFDIIDFIGYDVFSCLIAERSRLSRETTRNKTGRPPFPDSKKFGSNAFLINKINGFCGTDPPATLRPNGGTHARLGP